MESGALLRRFLRLGIKRIPVGLSGDRGQGVRFLRRGKQNQLAVSLPLLEPAVRVGCLG